MSTEKNNHVVWIVMGSDPEPGTEPDRYTFDTAAEREAFLQGVDIAIGWQDYMVVESNGVMGEDRQFIPEETA